MNHILKQNPYGMLLILQRTPKLTLRLLAAHRSNPVRNYSKDHDESSDDEKKPKKFEAKAPSKSAADKAKSDQDQEESAATKLNRLLASMKTDDPYSLSKSNATNKFSSPGSANRKRRETLKEEIAKKDVFTAAKRVASMLGNDEQQQKQTESELLAKLLGQKEEDAVLTEKKTPTETDMSLSELIVGMKIDRNAKRQNENLSRSDYVRRTLAVARNQQQQQQDRNAKTPRSQKPRKREAETFTGSVNLWNSEPLGIFKKPNELKESADMLTTWNHLQQHDLQLQVAHPPSNYFEKVALWTEQGKVWRFPIDNEQDWQLEETNVDFSEHIFLEQHLETWCPTKGPLRHFMELVCVGLSKNPYITAREKKEHILWYRDYFEQKKDMLKEYLIKDKPKRLNEKETS